MMAVLLPWGLDQSKSTGSGQTPCQELTHGTAKKGTTTPLCPLWIHLWSYWNSALKIALHGRTWKAARILSY